MRAGRANWRCRPINTSCDERDVRPVLDSAPVLELSGLTVGATLRRHRRDRLRSAADQRPAGRDPEPPRRGRGSLSLVRRLESLRERGSTAVIALSFLGPGGADAAAAPGPEPHGADRALQQAAFSPHLHAHLVVGEISAGFIDPHNRLAVFSDEDIFGPRAQARRAPRPPRTFGAEGATSANLKKATWCARHHASRANGLTA